MKRLFFLLPLAALFTGFMFQTVIADEGQAKTFIGEVNEDYRFETKEGEEYLIVGPKAEDVIIRPGAKLKMKGEIRTEGKGQAIAVEEVEVLEEYKAARLQGMPADQTDPQQAERWIGKPLVDVTGQKLGTVSEIITSAGKISYVLVKTRDDRIHPVPAQHFYTGAKAQHLQATFEHQYFEQSPGFSAEEVKQMQQKNWEQEVQSYYGQTEMHQGQNRK
jgi:hypothetical protein